MQLFTAGGILMLLAGAGLGWTYTEPKRPEIPETDSSAVTYTSEVKRLDRWISDGVARTQRDSRSWLGWESLANAYRERALFTGTTVDLVRAEQAMARSFEVAGAGVGPFYSRARLNASEHRYDRIEDDLDRASRELSLDIRDQAGIAALRASVDFQCGRYAQAFDGWNESLRLFSMPGTLFALADAKACTGDRDTAEMLIATAQQAADPRDRQMCAWLALQHGVMELDRGRWDSADALYQKANSILPGWWMVEARQAELQARRGAVDVAIRAYTSLVKRTGKPEIIDALAAQLRRAGRIQEASSWSRIARVAYEDLLVRQPEAAYGHALDHFLTENDDPNRTVGIAERNRLLRPGGEATIKLVQALLAAQRSDEARTWVELVLASPYRTVQLHVVAAAAYAACGDGMREAEQLRQARYIDPNA